MGSPQTGATHAQLAPPLEIKSTFPSDKLSINTAMHPQTTTDSSKPVVVQQPSARPPSSSSTSHGPFAHIASTRPAPPSPSPSRRESSSLSGRNRSRAGSSASGTPSSNRSSVYLNHSPANAASSTSNGGTSSSGAGRTRPPSTLIPQPGREDETIPPRDDVDDKQGSKEELVTSASSNAGSADPLEIDTPRRNDTGGPETDTPIAVTANTKKSLPRLHLIVRDFAFPPSDDRHHGIKPPPPESAPISTSSSEVALGSLGKKHDKQRKSSFGSWGTFSLGGFGWGSLKGAVTGRSGSRTGDDERPDLDTSILSPSSSFDAEDDQRYPPIGDDDDEYDEEEPLGPEPEGFYRAMFPFEAMGQYEMTVDQDEVLYVSGRGGGVGWVLAKRTREVREGELIEGLVPESYIEPAETASPEDGDDKQ